MDIILIPGLWLDASSWRDITPALEAAGHRTHALTMPGVGAPAAESADIGIHDWVDAVVAEIDRLDGPVVLVGHSGGGNVAWGAADRRPDRVARVIFVDTFPPTDGRAIWKVDAVDAVLPFPGWDMFAPADVADLDAETRERVAAASPSVPTRVPGDPISLRDPRRLSLPVTMLSGRMSAADLQQIAEKAPAWAADLIALEDLDLVELHSGHWPQFSQPENLSRAMVAALD